MGLVPHEPRSLTHGDVMRLGRTQSEVRYRFVALDDDFAVRAPA